jgi:predicted DNA-binding transcriptional regulator YafY
LKLDRVISVLVVLLRKERVKAKELAEMLGVSTRTILRDIDAINLAGIPVVTYQGAGGGIGLVEGYRLDKSVLTSDEMATIVAMLKGSSFTLLDKSHEILVEKLKNTLPPAQLAQFEQKAGRLVIDLSPWGGHALIKDRVREIRSAIDSSRLIEFTYTDATGALTRRKVEPYTLILKAQSWYLYAWCLLRSDFRLFKLARVKDLSVLETTFTGREMSPEQLVLEKEWINDQPIDMELLFAREMKYIALELFAEDCLEHDDGSIMVKIRLPENYWLYGFLLSFGAGMEVVNPPHIRSVLAKIAAEIYQQYSLVT